MEKQVGTIVKREKADRAFAHDELQNFQTYSWKNYLTSQ